MKKCFISFLLILSMLLCCINVYANNISVTLNGVTLDFDVQPQIISDRTFVPMRKIFESLGVTVSWDDETKTITGRKNDDVIILSIGSNTLIKNGTSKTLDVAPTIIDSRTLVPVRAIAESFECDVEWLSESQTVKITAKVNENNSKTVLSATQISDKVSPAVFYVEVYDSNSKAVASGSGFFISNDGVAVTNYHVIEDTYSAKITTIDGIEYDVNNIISYDESLDVAIIRVSKTSTDGKMVSSFPCLTLADSDQIKAGQTIYAIGSPAGLKNTISNGIISNTNQTLGEDSFIQITAPISHGSSGGALVDEYGEAIGITSAGIREAENIGFAIPINVVKLFDLTSTGMSYTDFASNTTKEFILELETDTVEINAGESTAVYVYADAEGDDWSIYWHTDQNDVVDCEWGDWEDDNICTLTITGIKEGTAIVTIYSDVDFQGKDVTVHVKSSNDSIRISKLKNYILQNCNGGNGNTLFKTCHYMGANASQPYDIQVDFVYNKSDDELYCELICDELSIAMIVWLDNDLMRNKAVTKIGYMHDETDGSSTVGFAEINLMEWRSSQTNKFDFYKYTSTYGNLLKKNDEDMAAILLDICLNAASKILKEYKIGIALSDFGFIYF